MGSVWMPLLKRRPMQFAASSYPAGCPLPLPPNFTLCFPPPRPSSFSPSPPPVQSKLRLSGLLVSGDRSSFFLPLQVHRLQEKQQPQGVGPVCFLGLLHRVWDPSHHLSFSFLLSPLEMPGLEVCALAPPTSLCIETHHTFSGTMWREGIIGSLAPLPLMEGGFCWLLLG